MNHDDYIGSNERPDGNRFCVMTYGHHGPCPSWWPDMATCLSLLARYCNSDCGSTVSVWERRSTKSREWRLITSTN